MSIRKVAIVGSQRIPFARSFGAYMGVSNQDLMTAAVQAVVKKYRLEGKALGEIALGAVIKHAADWNLAREVGLGTDLAPETPAYGVAQACGTSLETTILVANKIALGQIECGIAGGVDTNSDLPIVHTKNFAQALLKSSRGRTTAARLKPFLKLRPKDLKPVAPGVVEPRTHLSMGQSCELMAKEWKLTQAEQDELALASHMNSLKGWGSGFYADLVTEFNGLDKDNNVRESTLEKMGQLKPAFRS